MNATIKFLKYCAYNMRVSSLRMTTKAGSGHVTSAFSAADIVATLFFHTMRYDPNDPTNPDNDRFILSKGHAVPILYAVWKELGVLTEKDLLTYRDIESTLEGHPTMRFSRSEAATGSLGQGLSIGLGMSLSARMDKRDFRTYVLLGDSEISEGSIWEAAEIACYYKVDNLNAIVDVNRLGQTGETMHGHDLSVYTQKFQAFGWHTIVVDGHDASELVAAFDEAQNTKGLPIVILAKTIKGYGLSSIEDKNGFHGKAFTGKQLPTMLKELKDHFSDEASYESDVCKPQLPVSKKGSHKNSKNTHALAFSYKKDELVATRVAYGQVLAALGAVAPDVVSLDAEVKNSTFAELFEQKHKDRFIQCFIAEQNMVGMGVGLAARGKVPFISTFAAFFTRAFDQIRMAAVGQARLNLVGSHVGVSIGKDGPSQMGLEDIAMMNAVPDSVILYPADAVSTWALVSQMAAYKDGICYIRTTRAKTPVIYDTSSSFIIGGCNVVRESDKDMACVIAAGITLFEAIKAYEKLKSEGISIAVIDLYSIKPLDVDTLLRVGIRADKSIITVEDHYVQGGIGQIVSSALCNSDIKCEALAVKRLPRSGSTEALMALHEIDADAIIRKIHAIKKRG